MGMMGTVEVLPPGARTSVVFNFSPLQPRPGDVVKLTATVVPEGGTGSPLTGQVQFNIDGVNTDKMAALSNGQAEGEVVFPEKGDHLVKAMYWGDQLHAESASVSAIVKVR
jgi:hypothetical protein